MLQHQRLFARLFIPGVFLLACCAGCSDPVQEMDAAQLALDEVQRSYPDPEQILCEVSKAKRRADSGWTVDVIVASKQGNVRPNEHEVDVTPDGTVVNHSKNGEEVPVEGGDD